METSETYQTAYQLGLLQGASLASLIVWPGSEKARKMTATSGRKCLRLFEMSGQRGCWLKMFTALCLSSPGWFSNERYLTWKALATPYKRLLFRLAPSTPNINETEFGLWQTPVADDAVERETGKWNSRGEPKLSAQVKLWPTPTAIDASGGRVNRSASPNAAERPTLARLVKLWPTPRAKEDGDYQYSRGDKTKKTPTLAGAVKLWPTPQNRDYRTGSRDRWENPERSRNLNDVLDGLVNPEWEEMLMGYPPGWTEVD